MPDAFEKQRILGKLPQGMNLDGPVPRQIPPAKNPLDNARAVLGKNVLPIGSNVAVTGLGELGWGPLIQVLSFTGDPSRARLVTIGLSAVARRSATPPRALVTATVRFGNASGYSEMDISVPVTQCVTGRKEERLTGVTVSVPTSEIMVTARDESHCIPQTTGGHEVAPSNVSEELWLNAWAAYGEGVSETPPSRMQVYACGDGVAGTLGLGPGDVSTGIHTAIPPFAKWATVYRGSRLGGGQTDDNCTLHLRFLAANGRTVYTYDIHPGDPPERFRVPTNAGMWEIENDAGSVDTVSYGTIDFEIVL